jgi:alanine or glycine:cation symporter, AGCS family
MQILSSVMRSLTQSIEYILFFDIAGVPLLVLWLGCVSIYITARLRFVNIFGLKHAFDILRGKFSGNESKEQITPFQALMSSMAATIGTGSIVGVAVAVSRGGAGAVFWMMIFGFFGMSVKCAEVFLGHKYRIIHEDGTVTGGAFVYLKAGLKKMGFVRLGVILSFLFAICGFFGVLGIAGFQANQVVTIVSGGEAGFTAKKIGISLCATLICAYILLGGVKRISSFADKIVPFMIVLYVGTVAYIVFSNFDRLGSVITLIMRDAFDVSSGMTAFLAMVAIGARRALFACEAGQGTSPIINASSNVKHSQMQGMINLFDPLITTWVVCFSTALVLILSGVYESQAYEGAIMVQKAFGMYNPAFGYVVIVSIIFFAITTLITDSYYFTRIAEHLKISARAIYAIFFTFIFIAGIVHLDTIVAFADIFVLFMTIINTVGLCFLINESSREFKKYFLQVKNRTLNKG